MATASLQPPEVSVEAEASSGLPEGVPYRLSADDYLRMVDAEIIPPERRVGLWEGRLYEKMAKKMPHTSTGSMVAWALMRALPAGWCLWIEGPVLVNDFTAPLPDFTVVRGHPNDYSRRGAFPKAHEIGLVVEVAESSLRKNLTESLQVYARANLAVYWVVNLVANRVEVYSDPKAAGEGEGGAARYATADVFEVGKDLPLVLDGREVARIPARDLLPERAS